MVEFLAKECHADVNELGRYFFANQEYESSQNTALSNAASSGDLEMVGLLMDLGADINAVSNCGRTPVLEACCTNVDVAECLVKHGADVRKPDNNGETCLMKAVRWSKKLCQILINNGAEVNAQNAKGNSALHLAITSWDNYCEKADIVQILIDHGSNPYIKNKDGEDAFQTASLGGRELILEQLISRFQLSVERMIEMYELLGAYYVQHRSTINIGKVLPFWKKALEIRRMISCFSVGALQPNPDYIFFPDVRSVEELQTLCQNRDFVFFRALMIYERILGSDHYRVQQALMYRGAMYKKDGEYRHCINIFNYAFQLPNARVEQQTSWELRRNYLSPLFYLCWSFCEAYRECQQRNNRDIFEVDFEQVFQVLHMATWDIEHATGTEHSKLFLQDETLQLTFMKTLLHLMKLIIQLEKNEAQQLRFNTVVHRLIRCQPKTRMGQTLLHLSVKHCTSDVDGRFFSQFPSTAVVGLLLECGANVNVNAVDVERNTVLHLCSKAIQNLEMQQYHDSIHRIAVLLLKNGAHLDMVNISGERAAKGLTSSLIETNIQDFDSLQCMAARAIMKNKIPYVGNIIVGLESLVEMHGICASTG